MADEQKPAEQPTDQATPPGDPANPFDPANWPEPTGLPRGYHLAWLAKHAGDADQAQTLLDSSPEMVRLHDPQAQILHQQMAHDRQMAVVHGLAALNQAADYTNHLLEHLCNADYPQAGQRDAAWRAAGGPATLQYGDIVTGPASGQREPITFTNSTDKPMTVGDQVVGPGDTITLHGATVNYLDGQQPL